MKRKEEKGSQTRKREKEKERREKNFEGELCRKVVFQDERILQVEEVEPDSDLYNMKEKLFTGKSE